MKVLAIFSAILVVVTCSPKLRRTQSAATGPVVRTWTIKELFNALRNKRHPELQPSIKEGAHKFMLAMFLNIDWKNVLAAVTSPSGKSTWTNNELKEFMEIFSDTDEEYQSAVEHAHHLLNDLEADNPGADIKDVPVAIGAVDISIWNLEEVENAMASPDTRTELRPYLEQAQKELKLKNDTKATVTLVTPVGLITNNPEFLELTIPPTLAPYLKKKLRSDSENIMAEVATAPTITVSPPKSAVRSRSRQSDFPRSVFPKLFITWLKKSTL